MSGRPTEPQRLETTNLRGKKKSFILPAQAVQGVLPDESLAEVMARIARSISFLRSRTEINGSFLLGSANSSATRLPGQM